MKNISLLIILALFGLVACNSSKELTLDDIPESYIAGTRDIEMNRMNTPSDSSFPSLTVINSQEELDAIKNYFALETKLDDIDLSGESILFAFRFANHHGIEDITIKEISYTDTEQLHCKVYTYTKRDGDITNLQISALYHAFAIPKTPTENISYEVIHLDY